MGKKEKKEERKAKRSGGGGTGAAAAGGVEIVRGPPKAEELARINANIPKPFVPRSKTPSEGGPDKGREGGPERGPERVSAGSQETAAVPEIQVGAVVYGVLGL